MDGNGNIFVVDANYHSVYEMSQSCATSRSTNCIVQIGNFFNDPLAVSVDGSGNMYVGDFEASTVTEIFAVNGSIPPAPVSNHWARALRGC